jgi:hypothetical protein
VPLSLKDSLYTQFSAAIDMLGNAIVACPEQVWTDASQPNIGAQTWHEFWYLAYHTLFWLDFYLHDLPEEEFAPPAPFGLEEMDYAGVLPPRVYTKTELLSYLEHGRRKLAAKFAILSDDRAQQECQGFGRKDFTIFELYLYTMRHVQHHAAQLNLLLRQTTNSAPGWVGRKKN